MAAHTRDHARPSCHTWESALPVPVNVLKKENRITPFVWLTSLDLIASPPVLVMPLASTEMDIDIITTGK